MGSIALDRRDVIVGVDTHKHEHVAVAIDGIGGRLGDLVVRATPQGYGELIAWARSWGPVHAMGVEGTSSYGAGLTRFVRREEITVIEIDRGPRPRERRRDGKSDTIDAEHAARRVLAGQAVCPKRGDGIVEAIRLTRIARSGAVKARTQAMVTLRAVLVTADDDLRATLEPLPAHRLMAACAALDTTGDPADPAVAMHYTLAALAQRWLSLHSEIRAHTIRLRHLTITAAPDLVAAYGIGPDTAGELLVAAGDNPHRIRSEAAFAKLCGVCPLPTGSGQTAGRHRLNRGGNRRANAALHRVVVVRMRRHEPTIAYVTRRRAEGLTNKDIMRCLKRYLAREIYNLLPPLDDQ